MINPIDGNDIQTWVKDQVREARLARAREAVKGTKLGQQLPHMSDALLLKIAHNLEHPETWMRNLLLIHNMGRSQKLPHKPYS